MPKRAPSELSELLAANDPSAAQRAWQKFVKAHSSLLVQATRTLDGDYDADMDRYAFVLEKLRSNDFKRLRSFRPDGEAKFTTWLVVVAKRLCIDHHRRLYGRTQSEAGGASEVDSQRLARKRLAKLIGDRELASLPDPKSPDAESNLIARERREALEAELSQLSNRERLLLNLRFEDGATAREIADTLGFPSQVHVYRKLNKVLARLRRRLNAKGLRGGEQ